jgi:hypothetical protein
LPRTLISSTVGSSPGAAKVRRMVKPTCRLWALPAPTRLKWSVMAMVVGNSPGGIVIRWLLW